MAIKCVDVVPALVKKGGLLSTNEYETIEQVAERINRWVEQTGVSVINIETIISPYNKWQKMWYTTNGNTVDTWYQFVRVWYDDSPRGNKSQSRSS